MEFNIPKREVHQHKLNLDDAKLVRKLSSDLTKELGEFLKCCVLFGSSTGEPQHEHDIDVLLVIDDLTRVVTPSVVEAYRIIVERVGAEISKRFHINTLKISTLWEQARQGDPVLMNMLRDGVVFYDVGVFEPLQVLLQEGKIRPSRESVNNYAARAPITMQNADWHILQACIDLYWACIDIAHAALMKHGQLPPSPAMVGRMLRDTLVKKGMVKAKVVDTMDELYALQKDITHRNIAKMSGKQFDDLRARAIDFLKAMQDVLRV